jgi:hypothetical protein
MKLSLRVIFLLLAVFGLTACSSSVSRQSLFGLVPSSSFAVLTVDWQKVRNDGELKKVAKGAELESVLHELGVASESVSNIAVFSDGQKSAEGRTGMIAKGRFNSKDITQGLINSKKWKQDTIDGRRAYVNSADDACLLFLDSQVFVVSTRAGVAAVIEAAARPEMRFTSSRAYKTLVGRFESNQYPILMMLAFPQNSQDMANAALQISSTVMDIAGIGPLGQLLTKIGFAQGLGCAISRNNDSFPVEVFAVMKDEEAAQFVSGGLNLLKNLAAMAPTNNQSQQQDTAVRSLQSMSITRSREVLSIRMIMSRRDMAEMMHG